MIREIALWTDQVEVHCSIRRTPGGEPRLYRNPTAASLNRLHLAARRTARRQQGSVRPWLAGCGDIGWVLRRWA
jgi:hypothetical protein